MEYDVNWFYSDYLASEGLCESQNNYQSNSGEITSFLPINKKILIVTEGSSDSGILRKTINSLYPEISDFFNFIDMKHNYPFTGVGELCNFCKGLCKINIQNNIIVIFDNDTAGVEKYNFCTQSLQKPNSLVIIKLPDYFDFLHMKTCGLQGENIEDINGRAVAIECFLDFDSVQIKTQIRWTSLNNKINQYQGELENKDFYTRKFHKSRLTDGSYDTTKLRFLIDYIVKSWVDRNIAK